MHFVIIMMIIVIHTKLDRIVSCVCTSCCVMILYLSLAQKSNQRAAINICTHLHHVNADRILTNAYHCQCSHFKTAYCAFEYYSKLSLLCLAIKITLMQNLMHSQLLIGILLEFITFHQICLDFLSVELITAGNAFILYLMNSFRNLTILCKLQILLASMVECLPVMLASYSMLLPPYYAQNYAGIPYGW